jgi:type II secretory pathway pseudopilin PulG
MKNNHGFTLIEAMVAGGIAAFALSAMITLSNSENKSRGGLQAQMNIRQVLNAAINLFLARQNNFPPAMYLSGSGSPSQLTYVACYQINGVLTPNQQSAAGAFVGVNLPNAMGLPSGVCDTLPSTGTTPGPPNSAAQVEVQVQRIPATTATGSSSIQFEAIILPPLIPNGGTMSCPSLYSSSSGSPRNCNNANYVSVPSKVLIDTIDLSAP